MLGSHLSDPGSGPAGELRYPRSREIHPDTWLPEYQTLIANKAIGGDNISFRAVRLFLGGLSLQLRGNGARLVRVTCGFGVHSRASYRMVLFYCEEKHHDPLVRLRNRQHRFFLRLWGQPVTLSSATMYTKFPSRVCLIVLMADAQVTWKSETSTYVATRWMFAAPREMVSLQDEGNRVFGNPNLFRFRLESGWSNGGCRYAVIVIGGPSLL